MVTKKTTFLNSVRQLTSETSDALLLLTIFNEFKDFQSLRNYSTFLNFVQVVRNATLLSFKITISKLIDKKGVSIITLTKFLKSNPTLFDKTKEQTQKHIGKIENILKRNSLIIEHLTKHRNKYYAHIDQNNIKDTTLKVFKDYEVKQEEIEPFLIDIIECLGELQLYYLDNSSKPFEGPTSEEIIKSYLIDKESIKTHLKLKEIIAKIKNNNAT